MRRVCVFCGSSAGVRAEYAAAARGLGALLAREGIGLVFGGGGVGLMGALADAALAAGGEVIGVIPHGLVARELAHPAVRDLRIVTTIHERKALMNELSDGFLALPGGLGTLEEFFEVWSWAQLGAHGKSCGLLNVYGYWAPLLALLDHLEGQGFVQPADRDLILVEADAARLLARMAAWQPPPRPHWLTPDTT